MAKIRLALGEKDVGLVEENASPFVRKAEAGLQFILDINRSFANVTVGNGIERSSCVVGHILCR